MILHFASDRSVLVSFGEEISPEVHQSVFRLFRLLQDKTGIRNLHPAYSSLLIDFDPLELPAPGLEALVRDTAAQLDSVALPTSRTVELPVVYGGEFGPDLAGVAAHTKLSPEQVVRLHCGVEYLVYFLGFSPGFPYLGGLPPALATPRLDAPRIRVPAGSVAIGGSQTGVYPMSSPGGWCIIGRTPARLFDAQRNPPTLLEMGDRVKFVPLAAWPTG